MIKLTQEPIDTTALLADVQHEEAGAVVLFLGTTRKFTAGRETIELYYDAYQEMATQELERLEQEARERWSLVECAIVHRLGLVPLKEASVAVAVSSAHRGEAFEAGKWLIDTLKEHVPIWKQEHWADGSQEWVHPGAPSSSVTGGDA
ncbi:molybdenum cofactor biosynthesis protein MoaE [Adhaeretor mobilis]|uniref:Molybdopterin synthase catalytic subunit n=1 Tax=Adhaeretor mobilis TaxID=1930276 RepID=A0A517MUI8_9BACT|nr:molybdenum cofactor biosynthesis protein MoaE [Adhaeretor mobilis]QDS98554.1 Molybdopterin synthase catalytic subunit [Adhaeretor mobilis]